jgi:predicted DNA-binding transcriptional regulator YafY
MMEELRARAPRPTTCAHLAELLGVHERTVQRDLANLAEAGVPIASRRGPGGGYRFDAPALARPVTFTAAEAGAVITAIAAIGPDASSSVERALRKVIRALG